MTKKIYVSPEAEVVVFDSKDILIVSPTETTDEQDRHDQDW